MSVEIAIADRFIGQGHPSFVIAEIGINHNGDLDIARALVDVAAEAGCDAVKLQKRTPELCVPPEQRDVVRETPWGAMTYLDYRHRVEFGAEEYGRALATAWQLAKRGASVRLFEREHLLSSHSSGRNAAIWMPMGRT